MEVSKLKIGLRSLLVSYILSGILLLAISFILYKFRIKENQVKLAVNAVYILSCLAGGFIMGKGIKQRRFFWGLLLGLLYFGILLLVSYVMKTQLSTNTLQLVTTIMMCALSGTVGGMLS